MRNVGLLGMIGLLATAGCGSASEPLVIGGGPAVGIAIDAIRDAESGANLSQVALVTMVWLQPRYDFTGGESTPDSITGSPGQAEELALNRGGRFRVRVAATGYVTWEQEVFVEPTGVPAFPVKTVKLHVYLHRTDPGT